jgi:hypothetical protein
MGTFRSANAWIEESALFDCLRQEAGRVKVEWWKWDKKVRDRDADTLKALRKKHKADIDMFIATQLLFDKQWAVVKVRTPRRMGLGLRSAGERCHIVAAKTGSRFGWLCSSAPFSCILSITFPRCASAAWMLASDVSKPADWLFCAVVGYAQCVNGSHASHTATVGHFCRANVDRNGLRMMLHLCSGHRNLQAIANLSKCINSIS